MNGQISSAIARQFEVELDLREALLQSGRIAAPHSSLPTSALAALLVRHPVRGAC
jgi:hypothetical protein